MVRSYNKQREAEEGSAPRDQDINLVPLDQTLDDEKPAGPWDRCNMFTALAALMFCPCTLFGLLSTIFSTFSYVEYNSSNVKKSNYHHKVALRFALMGIFIGLVVLTTFGLLVVVYYNEMMEILGNVYKSIMAKP